MEGQIFGDIAPDVLVLSKQGGVEKEEEEGGGEEDGEGEKMEMADTRFMTLASEEMEEDGKHEAVEAGGDAEKEGIPKGNGGDKEEPREGGDREGNERPRRVIGSIQA
jgi:hypothetical protein